MNKRHLFALIAFLALIIGLSFLFLVQSPHKTLESALQRTESTDEQTREQRQATSVVEVAESLATSTNSAVSTPDEEGPSGSSAARLELESVDSDGRDVNSSVANTPTQPQGAAPVLSEFVFAAIQDVQQLQLDGRWDESLLELNALYENFDELNSFEQTTLLNFYTNTLLRLEMWPEAIGAFSKMLTVPELRPDLGARALMALGQLHAEVGEYAASISYLRSWQDVTVGMENMERSNQRVAELLEQSRASLQGAALEEQ